MDMRKITVLTACFAISTSLAVAQDQAAAPAANQTQIASDYPFDNRIDTWIQGTIITLDADGKRLAVRGQKLPYASAYAGMVKELNEELAKIDPAGREAKEKEIRQDWQEKLDKAANEQLGGDSDFKLNLPDPKKETVLIQPMTSEVQQLAFLGQDEGIIVAAIPAEARPIDAGAPASDVSQSGLQTGEYGGTSLDELSAIKTLSQLKIGQRVLVGYDAGALSSEAHSIVVASAGDLPPSETNVNIQQTTTEQTAPAPADPAAPAPADANIPAPVDQTTPAPADASFPAPVDQTAPAPAEQPAQGQPEVPPQEEQPQ